MLTEVPAPMLGFKEPLRHRNGASFALNYGAVSEACITEKPYVAFDRGVQVVCELSRTSVCGPKDLGSNLVFEMILFLMKKVLAYSVEGNSAALKLNKHCFY